MNNANKSRHIIAFLLIFALLFSVVSCTSATSGGYGYSDVVLDGYGITVPAYSGEEYYVLNKNVPFFKESEITVKSYEFYDELDGFGRCTVAHASIGVDLMPTESRDDISSVKPSGWVQAKYDIINGKYLYNRSHLIGFQLTGENETAENLITGTRYMNEAMIPFENMVADYIKETENHVMYRVTPIFIGADLVASGVIMEAYSVEDSGDGVSFCVFIYNVQPGVVINYATGESHLAGESDTSKNDSSNENNDNSENNSDEYFVINTNSKLIHASNCANAAKISDKNREEYSGDIEDLIDDGYRKAGCCLDK